MGATQNSRANTVMMELGEIGDEDVVYEQRITYSECCGVEFKSISRTKMVWENNFLHNCQLLRPEARWVDIFPPLIKENKLSRTRFYSEVANLRKIKEDTVTTDRDVLMSPAEIEEFKGNLRKSVLLTFGQPKNHPALKGERITTHMKLRPSRITIDQFRMSKAQRNRNESTGSNLRKSIMSFVDDTLSSVFGSEKEISKQTALELEGFLRFSMIIEKHLNDPLCVLYHIRKVFVGYLEKNYGEPLAVADSQRVDELTDTVKQFLILLKECAMEYYHLHLFDKSNELISDPQNILSAITSIVLKDTVLHSIVFNAIVAYHREKEDRFASILDKLACSSPQAFSVKQEYCLNEKTLKNHGIDTSVSSTSSQERSKVEEPYRECILALNEIAKSRTPVGKMKAIMACAERITKQIGRFYKTNQIELKQYVLDADQVLSIFCFLIAGARVPNLHSHLYILENFATEHQLISVTGYYYSVLTCALEQLEQDNIVNV